jgi:hypothetical protein
MAVYFTTNNPAGLHNAFKQAIANHQHQRTGGQRINTWIHVVHQGDDYYTHAAQQWKEMAFFRVAAEPNRLAFYIVPSQGGAVTREVYAYYAGHLIETFIRHFPTMFTGTQATPNAAVGDASF